MHTHRSAVRLLLSFSTTVVRPPPGGWRVFDHQHRRHLALGRLALPSRFSGEGAVELGACVAILDVFLSPSALTSPSARLAGAPRVDACAVDGRQSLTHGFSQACRRCAGPPRTLPAACRIFMASRAFPHLSRVTARARPLLFPLASPPRFDACPASPLLWARPSSFRPAPRVQVMPMMTSGILMISHGTAARVLVLLTAPPLTTRTPTSTATRHRPSPPPALAANQVGGPAAGPKSLLHRSRLLRVSLSRIKNAEAKSIGRS